MNNKLALLVVFFFLIFLAPQALRPALYNDSMIGSTTYFHERMAELIAGGQGYDALSFGGRPYTYPPGFHVFLSLLLPVEYFLPPLMGVLGIILCYYFARELGFKEKESLMSSAILGFLTGYVYLAGHLNPRLPALLMLITAFLFFMRTGRDRRYGYAAAPLLALVLYFSPLVGVVGLVFGAVLFRREWKALVLPYSAAVALFLAWFLPFFMQYGLPSGSKFYSVYIELQSGLQYFIFEHGMVSDSLPVFALIVALFAIFKYKELKFLREWFILAVIASIVFGNRLNEQLLFPVAMLVGVIVSLHWSDFVKALYIDRLLPAKAWKALFLAYIALAGLVAGGALLFFPPGQAEYASMQWISQNTPAGSVVMADWSYGHWISAIAGRPNVIDAYAEYAPDLDERYDDLREAIDGSDLESTLEILQKYGVSYVFYYPKEGFCTGFAAVAKAPYFERAFSLNGAYVFKVDYAGTSPGYDVCASLE